MTDSDSISLDIGSSEEESLLGEDNNRPGPSQGVPRVPPSPMEISPGASSSEEQRAPGIPPPRIGIPPHPFLTSPNTPYWDSSNSGSPSPPRVPLSPPSTGWSGRSYSRLLDQRRNSSSTWESPPPEDYFSQAPMELPLLASRVPPRGKVTTRSQSFPRSGAPSPGPSSSQAPSSSSSPPLNRSPEASRAVLRGIVSRAEAGELIPARDLVWRVAGANMLEEDMVEALAAQYRLAIARLDRGWVVMFRRFAVAILFSQGHVNSTYPLCRYPVRSRSTSGPLPQPGGARGAPGGRSRGRARERSSVSPTGKGPWGGAKAASSTPHIPSLMSLSPSPSPLLGLSVSPPEAPRTPTPPSLLTLEVRTPTTECRSDPSEPSVVVTPPKLLPIPPRVAPHQPLPPSSRGTPLTPSVSALFCPGERIRGRSTSTSRSRQVDPRHVTASGHPRELCIMPGCGHRSRHYQRHALKGHMPWCVDQEQVEARGVPVNEVAMLQVEALSALRKLLMVAEASWGQFVDWLRPRVSLPAVGMCGG